MGTKSRVLVCGGAGFIGSHMCKALARAGHVPVTFDNLSTGHRWAVRWGPLVQGDLLDPEAVARAFRDHPVDAVMHFAGLSLVSESMQQPGRYFRNNVGGTLNLLDAMLAAGVSRLVFSSTAAVYGAPESTPISEGHPTRPINPYGASKLMAEQIIEWYCRARGLRAVCLRYFNAAGADPDGEIGEVHDPETHLIPNVIRAAIDPNHGPLGIFGNDYETPDGTCVRDYIHVADLCDAHLLALRYLDGAEGCRAFNLGSGKGYSVAQVVAACHETCAGSAATTIQPRRPGDPAVLLASTEAATESLGWHPSRGLADCVADALRWYRSRRLTETRNVVP